MYGRRLFYLFLLHFLQLPCEISLIVETTLSLKQLFHGLHYDMRSNCFSCVGICACICICIEVVHINFAFVYFCIGMKLVNQTNLFAIYLVVSK